MNFGSLLCLFLAPQVEWDPSDGMYGLVDRLVEWLRRAAVNDLDPLAAPMHPPYAPLGSAVTAVVRENAPHVGNAPWFGFAPIEDRTDTRVDLRGWLAWGDSGIKYDGDVAPVVLSQLELPYEYPTKLGPFIEELTAHNIAKERLLNVLRAAAHHNHEGAPLFVVIGTPMRGTRGGERRQHLAVWHVDADDANHLRLTVPQPWDTSELEELRSQLFDSMMRWADSAEIKWCSVDEARPEVTRPRAGNSPIAEFVGRSVAILGCGAIGSHLAEHLVRGGVTNLMLVDNRKVTTGNLSRQTYDQVDLAVLKVRALARRLRRINPQLQPVQCSDDAVELAGDQAAAIWQQNIIIDATANQSVAKRLESTRPTLASPPWVISMLLGHRGDRGLLTVAPPTNIGGSPRLARHAKHTAAVAALESFIDEFWPRFPRSDLFLPEPGCSAPTFIGADADVAALVAALTRAAGTALRRSLEGSWTMIELPDADPGMPARSERRVVTNPIELEVAGEDFSVQIEHHVMIELLAWISEGMRDSPGSETGGILYGEIDNATRTIAVTAALGPPPDSRASPSGFVCGTLGVDAASEALDTISRGIHHPIGMWHTHPHSSPAASPTDFQGMQTLTGQHDRPLPQQLLLIGGGSPVGSHWNAYIFETRPPKSTTHWPQSMPNEVHCDNSGAGRIGLALSGGGLRAAAFHLGCLRALNDRGLLDQVTTISGVSGGSIVTALWAYTNLSFEDFEATLVSILRRGLWKPIIAQCFAPHRLAKIAATTLTAGLASAPNAVLGKGGAYQRRTSSVHAFEAAINSRITDAQITEVAREGLSVIINACDLRTGTAFRFGSIESGSWRDGTIKHNCVSVAQATAASAAHPLAFPAYDLVATFTRRDGSEHERRVILSDGGIYDNLGTSPLLPGRDSAISTNVSEPHDWIIACDAGRGLFDGTRQPYWFAGRVKQSLDTTFRKAQDTDRSKLLDLVSRPEAPKGVIVAMLGMRDHRLPVPVQDLVPREQVIGFRTNLRALSQDHLELLARRGQQIMAALIPRYGPHV